MSIDLHNIKRGWMLDHEKNDAEISSNRLGIND